MRLPHRSLLEKFSSRHTRRCLPSHLPIIVDSSLTSRSQSCDFIRMPRLPPAIASKHTSCSYLQRWQCAPRRALRLSKAAKSVRLPHPPAPGEVSPRRNSCSMIGTHPRSIELLHVNVWRLPPVGIPSRVVVRAEAFTTAARSATCGSHTRVVVRLPHRSLLEKFSIGEIEIRRCLGNSPSSTRSRLVLSRVRRSYSRKARTSSSESPALPHRYPTLRTCLSGIRINILLVEQAHPRHAPAGARKSPAFAGIIKSCPPAGASTSCSSNRYLRPCSSSKHIRALRPQAREKVLPS